MVMNRLTAPWFRKLALTLMLAVLPTIGMGVPPLVLTPPQGTTFDKSFFGMHVHDPEKPSRWPTAPFGSWRLWDTGVTWATIQPARRGDWYFDKLDRRVGLAEAKGVEPVLVLGMTPTWASRRPSERSPYGTGQAAPPSDLDDWRAYVAAVAKRYKGRIKAYQVWNEANLDIFWTGSMPELIELTRIAWEEIKKEDPKALVISPSGTGLDDRMSWLRKFLDGGGAKYVDVLAYHFYTGPRPPEAMAERVAQLRALLAAGGYKNKPLWNTESGYFMYDSRVAGLTNWSDYEMRNKVEPVDVDNYIARGFLLARALGVERYYWYAWDNKKLGFVDPDNLRPRGVAVAYSNAYKQLLQSTLNGCTRSASGVWECTLVLATGKPARALWMDPSAGKASISVPVTPDSSAVYLDATPEEPVKTGSTIKLDGRVVLVSAK